MAGSQAVAADLLRKSLGESGATIVSLLVVIATLGSINATIFTGARTNFALGQDVSPFRWLGRWHPKPSSPTTAYLLQGAIALLCTICGYLLYSSLVYTGIGAIIGVIVVLFGIPFVRRSSN